MTATMRDVAKEAGVSVKTVSNVVNDFAHVRPETRQRVLEAIDRLGYQMNFAARSLSLGRSGMITLAVPALTWPYFAELSEAVIDAAAARGYTVLVEQTGGLLERELEVLVSERRRMTDGLILSPVALRGVDAPELEVDFPMVLLGERSLTSRVPHVAMANRDGARAVAEHLLGLGRRRIAVVGGYDPDGVGAGALRTQGLRDALQAAGVRHSAALNADVRAWTREGGHLAMTALLERGTEIDSVMALNDVLALGALRALADRGVRVPDDVAVVGFDDIDEARWSTPRLTTVHPGRAEIAQAAMDLLAARMGGGEVETGRAVLAPFELRLRESTLGPGAV